MSKPLRTFDAARSAGPCSPKRTYLPPFNVRTITRVFLGVDDPVFGDAGGVFFALLHQIARAILADYFSYEIRLLTEILAKTLRANLTSPHIGALRSS